MSPNINSFVGDLVQMAEAVKALPIVEAEARNLQVCLDSALKHNQGLEENIIFYKSEIEALNSRIRSLEVERDDASFRVLEAEDSAAMVLSKAQVARATLDVIIAKLDPPKPEPELQPQAVPTTTDQSVHGSLPEPKPETFSGFEPKGSSESSPTSNATDGEPKSEQTSVTSSANSDATSVEEAPKSDANPTSETTKDISSDQSSGSSDGPYFNKRYHDMPNYISLHDWLNGGGTENDYYWQSGAR